MKKVYLVNMHECDEKGTIKEHGKTIVNEVFTNKKLAKAYAKRMNDYYWKENEKWWWHVEERNICELDYRKD